MCFSQESTNTFTSFKITNVETQPKNKHHKIPAGSIVTGIVKVYQTIAYLLSSTQLKVYSVSNIAALNHRKKRGHPQLLKSPHLQTAGNDPDSLQVGANMWLLIRLSSALNLTPTNTVCEHFPHITRNSCPTSVQPVLGYFH